MWLKFFSSMMNKHMSFMPTLCPIVQHFVPYLCTVTAYGIIVLGLLSGGVWCPVTIKLDLCDTFPKSIKSSVDF